MDSESINSYCKTLIQIINSQSSQEIFSKVAKDMFSDLYKFPSPLREEQFSKVTQLISSHLFKMPTKNQSYLVAILNCLAPGDKDKEGNIGIEFVNLVISCALQCCKSEKTSYCVKFARYLTGKAKDYIKVKTPINSILRIIAVWLHLVDCQSQKFEDLFEVLLANEEILHTSPLLFNFMDNINRKPSSVEDQHEDQSCAQSSFGCEAFIAYLSPSLFALNLLCNMLTKSLKCGWTEQLATTGNSRKMLSTIMHLLHADCQLVFATLSDTSEKKADKSWMLGLACATFSFSIKYNLKLQKSRKVIKDIFISKWIGNEEIKAMLSRLRTEYKAWQTNDKKKEVLSLRCEACWLFLKCHPDNLSGRDLEDFLLDTYINSELLLKHLFLINYSEMKNKVIEFLKDWSTVEDRVKTITAPLRIVATWVEYHCLYQSIHVKDDNFDSPILYDLLSPSIEVSEKGVWVLFVQEYKAYVNMSSKYSSFCHKMKMKIRSGFMQLIYTNPKSFSQKAPTHPPKEMTQVHSILMKAIKIMEEISKDEQMPSEENPICHQLFVAYCLCDLCMPKANTYLELTFEAKALSRSIMILLYSIFDLLQLKAMIIHSDNVYQLVIDMQKLMNFSVNKQLTLLWESRRLSHPLCISPLNWLSIQKISDATKDIPKETYMDCLEKGFQQNFYFLSENSHINSESHGIFFRSNVSDDDIQNAARDLTSKDPTDCHSTFLAGYVYLDLCQKHIANGRLLEALSFAKEAHKLHSELFNSKFTNKKKSKGHTEAIDFSSNLWEMTISVSKDVLPFCSLSRDFDKTYISPWKILQCYLESILQVGTIFEMIGDGAEAVAHLRVGEEISYSLNSPLFSVAFSSLLGKLYAQQHKLPSAEKALEFSQKLLDKSKDFGCSKCELLLRASVIEHLADLRQIKPDACEGIGIVLQNPSINLYESALEKLNTSDWRNCLSCPSGGVLEYIECSCSEEIENEMKLMSAKSENKNKEKINTKRSWETESHIIHESDSRKTPPKRHVLNNRLSSIPTKSNVNEYVEESKVLDQVSCKTYSNCKTKCVFSKMGCWYCLPSKVGKSGLIIDLINLKWEFVRRKVSMRLLSRSGKYFTNSKQTDQVQKSLLRRISFLVGQNTFKYTFSSISPDHFRHLVEMGNPDDVFAVERAEIVHDVCLYLMQDYHSTSRSKLFSHQSSIKFEEIASWLIRAFVQSRDVPKVLQEVSKLLTVMYLISSMNEQSSWLSLTKVLNKSRWIFYFHQVAVGTHLSSQFLTNSLEGPNVTAPSYMRESTFNLLRLPGTIEDLEKQVNKFLDDLPSTTIICLSFLGHDYTSLLKKLLCHPNSVEAWMLVSRRSVQAEPIVVLLPLDSIVEDTCSKSNYKRTTQEWVCRWGVTVVDHIAPSFKTILEQYYYMGEEAMPLKEKKKKVLRKGAESFDERLRKYLRDIEMLCFGSWKFLLLGDLVNCKNFDSVLKDLLEKLRSTSDMDVNESLVRIILGGFSKDVFPEKSSISSMSSDKDCYIANIGYIKKSTSGVLLKAANVSQKQSSVFKEALNLLEVDDSAKRGPIILVLDNDIQMLPWESLRILTTHEVYRMPSVGSISFLLDKCSNQKEQARRDIAPFSSINPLHGFYVLNPDGTLPSFQKTFEIFFKENNLEGIAGSKPTLEELVAALERCDIYLYFGHGSGNDCIPDYAVKKLKKCSAALLMGCSSGSLTLQGIYSPIGTPLFYLMAGSPVVIAHLWEMLDTEVCLFGKAFFEAILKDLKLSSESGSPSKCVPRQGIGAFMSQKRISFRRPVISGASLVCYGLPVEIRRQGE